MENLRKPLSEFINFFPEYSRFTVGIETKHRLILLIARHIQEVEEERVRARAEGRESDANEALAWRLFLIGMSSELGAWVSLQLSLPEKAWKEVVNAESSYRSAARCHRWTQSISVEARLDQVLDMQRLLFPTQTFISPGFDIIKILCSICQDDFEKCDHIPGRAYSGNSRGTIA